MFSLHFARTQRRSGRERCRSVVTGFVFRCTYKTSCLLHALQAHRQLLQSHETCPDILMKNLVRGMLMILHTVQVPRGISEKFHDLNSRK